MNNVATYGVDVFAHLDRLPPQLMLVGYWKWLNYQPKFKYGYDITYLLIPNFNNTVLKPYLS
jgi:hypothetical protein